MVYVAIIPSRWVLIPNRAVLCHFCFLKLQGFELHWCWQIWAIRETNQVQILRLVISHVVWLFEVLSCFYASESTLNALCSLSRSSFVKAGLRKKFPCLLAPALQLPVTLSIIKVANCDIRAMDSIPEPINFLTLLIVLVASTDRAKSSRSNNFLSDTSPTLDR